VGRISRTSSPASEDVICNKVCGSQFCNTFKNLKMDLEEVAVLLLVE
jgi:hypothetical protein